MFQRLSPACPHIAGHAPSRQMLAMHVDQARRPGPFMQVIDILRYDEEIARPVPVQLRQRHMRGIGLGFLDILPPHIVEVQNKVWIAGKRFWRGNILNAMLLPQAAFTAEGVDATFRADARARKNDNIANILHASAYADKGATRQVTHRRLSAPRLWLYGCSTTHKGNFMTGIAIIGKLGRMGQAILAEADAAGLSIAGGIDAGEDPAPLAREADVLIDFSAPEALLTNLGAAVAAGTPILIGTTGLTEDHHRAIDDAANHVAVLQTGNTSLGVTLLARLVREAATRLGQDWDIEIVEMHHRMKVDAPSGTALLLGEAAAQGRNIRLADHSERGRDGHTGARAKGAIGFASLRGGSVAGDHSVILAADDERIELTHRAENRTIFARGALKAATWLTRQPAGRYTMDQVLGL
ncbi:MAG: 4-hydroxy-tetrahydrodipicolinate reductase [Pseudomonadota bacterium]